MTPEEISRFSQTLDDANYKALIAGMHVSELPLSMHSRALDSYFAAARDPTGPLGRFLAWRQAASFGHGSFVEELKGNLSIVVALDTQAASMLQFEKSARFDQNGNRF
jgi:hypothetical protein